jgi:hypothetical protein
MKIKKANKTRNRAGVRINCSHSDYKADCSDQGMDDSDEYTDEEEYDEYDAEEIVVCFLGDISLITGCRSRRQGLVQYLSQQFRPETESSRSHYSQTSGSRESSTIRSRSR